MNDETRQLLDALHCGCRVEVRDDETLHVIPCTPEHGRSWDEHLPAMLAELGYGDMPIVSEP